MSLLFLCIYLLRNGIGAAPIYAAVDTGAPYSSLTLPTLQGQDIESRRTIWDILWGCIVTTFACTWVSVHPNIPAPGDSRWTIAGRRAQAMFCALVAPELMIGWAYRQRLGADRIQRAFKDQNWTMTHAHFLQMGGFMLYEGDEAIGILDPGMLYQLLENMKIDLQKFPSITRLKEDIDDKSNSDALTKGLAVIQTTWFIAQCIARGAQGLAVTELEITTLGLATLNGVMYFLWWDKPYNVNRAVPVYLKPRDIRTPLLSQEGDDLTSVPGDLGQSRVDGTRFQDDCPQPLTVDNWTEWITAYGRELRLPEITPLPLVDWLLGLLEDWAKAIGKGKAWIWNALTNTATWRNRDEMGGDRTKDQTLVRRLWLTAAVKPMKIAYVTLIKPLLELLNGLSMVESLRVSTFYVSGEDGDSYDIRPFYVGSVLGSVFGAIHLIAWSFQFPSHAERILWRASSLVVTGVPLFCLVEVIILMVVDIPDFLETFLRWLFLVLPILLYIPARVLLLILALISLHDLPSSAYDTVRWTTFVPHI